jgi:hypothetical protein
MSDRFTNRPPSFLQMEEARVKEELDKGFSRIYDAHAQLDQQVVRGPSGIGFMATSGEVTVTGSKLRIVTGLTKVLHVVASIAGAAATNQWVTVQVTPSDKSKIDVFVWKPTAAGDNTPIASTSAIVVKWFCTGS